MSDANNIAAGLAEIVAARIPGLDLMGSHTYRVTAVHAGGRCDLDPVESTMQPLALVDQWLGGGEVTTPAVGSLCSVEFRDRRSDRPMITRFQPLRVDGGTPTKAAIDATTIELGGASAAALALAAETLANVNAIADAIATAVVGVSDGGALFKTNIGVALAAAGFPIALATTKVKGV